MNALCDKESCGELTTAREGAAAVVTLNRPQALNAITGAMRSRLAAEIPVLARDANVYALIMRSATPRAFSAGGDLRELAHAARNDPDLARRLLADDYALCWLLECFSKPTVSLINGLVMGSGAGITTFGTHRVAGEDYAFAMPETAVGFFPDAGLAWAFAGMPAEIGLYLGLTGRSLGRADAYHLGLVTHCVPASRFHEIEDGLRAADPVDPMLDDRHENPGPGELETRRESLAHCFSGETVEEICTRVAEAARRGGEAGEWFAAVHHDLEQRSPTALKVTLRHIREAKYRDLRQTLMIDYRLARQFLQTHDFHEGIRALLIDKDRQPRWSPKHLAEVTDGMVERFFAYLPGRGLILPTRQEMQAARV